MKPPATVARPTGLAETWVDACASKEFFWRSEELLIWCRPSDDDLFFRR